MSPTPTARIRRRRIAVPLVAGCLVASAAPALALGTHRPRRRRPRPTWRSPRPRTGAATSRARRSSTRSRSPTPAARAVPRADILVSDAMLADLAPADGGGDRRRGPRPGREHRLRRHARSPRPPTAAPSPTPPRSRCARSRRPARTPTPPTTAPPTPWTSPAARARRPIAISSVAKPVAPPSPPGAREALPQSQPAACPPPKLRARVTAPRKVRAGKAALFTIRVHNATGAAAARRAHLTVRLPAGFSLTTPVESSVMKGGAMRWSIGTLAPRAARSLPVTLRADRTASGTRGARGDGLGHMRLGPGDGPRARGPGGAEAGAPPGRGLSLSAHTCVVNHVC